MGRVGGSRADRVFQLALEQTKKKKKLEGNKSLKQCREIHSDIYNAMSSFESIDLLIHYSKYYPGDKKLNQCPHKPTIIFLW